MMVKRALLVILIILLLSPLYAFSFFYGVGGVGEANGESHYAGLSVNAGFSFFSEPYLMLDGEVALSPFFESVAVNLSSSPFSTPVHLDFLFANPVLYSPKVKLGAEYVYQDGWYYRAELALINFRSTDFEYEFFTPMLTVDATDYTLGYGIRIMKFSYFI